MGLDYGIELIIPADRVEALLIATADVALRPTKSATVKWQWGQAQVIPSGERIPPLAETSEYEKPLVVHLPSRRTALLPFTSRFKTDPVHLSLGGNGLSLDTVLAFPPDDALRSYQEDGTCFSQALERGGEQHVAVGMIFLTVHLGVSHAVFSYTAATTQMSLLFQRSRSVHATFLNLLAKADGLVGLFYQETDTYPLLSDPSRSVWIDETYVDDAYYSADQRLTSFYADRFAESALRQL